MNARVKRILITSGPTWVPIDAVRVIANTASGATGIRLANRLIREGNRVTLLLGPCADGTGLLKHKRLTIRRFRYFGELEALFSAELKKRYDAVIHSAAVSDYAPMRRTNAKIPSDRGILTLKLHRTPKLIDRIRHVASHSFAVGFKYLPGTGRSALIRSARKLLDNAQLDMVVANTVRNGRYEAWIVSHCNGVSKKIGSKNTLITALTRSIRIL